MSGNSLTMLHIKLRTKINADISIVFDLSRSIDLHKISTAHTNEEAIAGKTSGLIEFGETVTWKAKHFRISQQLTSKITAFERPHYFVDEMVSGAFESFRHQHIFESEDDATNMYDIFEFKVPGGVLGSMIGQMILKPYLKTLLEKRNQMIKDFAESDQWRSVLQQLP